MSLPQRHRRKHHQTACILRTAAPICQRRCRNRANHGTPDDHDCRRLSPHLSVVWKKSWPLNLEKYQRGRCIGWKRGMQRRRKTSTGTPMDGLLLPPIVRMWPHSHGQWLGLVSMIKNQDWRQELNNIIGLLYTRVYSTSSTILI